MEAVFIERSLWINATRERVWKAITDPVEIEKWFSPGTAWQFSGDGVGAEMYVPNAETGERMYTQVVDVKEPPHRYVTHAIPAAGAQAETSDWVLLEEDGGTRLKFIYKLHDSAMAEQHAMGFELMLGNVKAVVEGTPLPHPEGF